MTRAVQKKPEEKRRRDKRRKCSRTKVCSSSNDEREGGGTMDSTCEDKEPMSSSWFQQFKVVQELSREVKKLQMNASVFGAKLPFSVIDL